MNSSRVTARFVTSGEDGRMRVLAIRLGLVNAACRQVCAKGDEGCAKLLIERDDGKVEGHEIYHGEPETLVGQVAPAGRLHSGLRCK